MEQKNRIETAKKTIERIIREETTKAVEAFMKGDAKKARSHSDKAAGAAMALGVIEAVITDDLEGF